MSGTGDLPVRGGYISSTIGGAIGGAAGVGLVLATGDRLLSGDEVSATDSLGASFWGVVVVLGLAVGLWAGGIALGLRLEGVGGSSSTIAWSAAIAVAATVLLGNAGVDWPIVAGAAAVSPLVARAIVVTRPAS